MEICIFPYYSIPYQKTFVKNLKYFYGFLSFLINQKRTPVIVAPSPFFPTIPLNVALLLIYTSLEV